MKEKDLYEDLIKFYEFTSGELPGRETFKQALEATFTKDDLRIFFLLPFYGNMVMEKFEKKANRIGISKDQLHEEVKRLVPEGLISTYVTSKGRVCERAPMISLIELQVRKEGDTAMRRASLELMNEEIESAGAAVTWNTSYYRVIPVESTITGDAESGKIAVNADVPDPREVLPIDILSEMIKKEPLIALADCYCRTTKKLLGEGCEHSMETCFYFNELAQMQLETGYARKIDYDEAMRVLWDCERQGLIHNISNCEGHIQTLCNCCAHACPVVKSMIKGKTNLSSPSRFMVAFNEERCVLCGECVDACQLGNISLNGNTLEIDFEHCAGCGLCVSRCPEGALHMVPRKKPPKIFADSSKLWNRLMLDAFISLAWKKIKGKFA